MFISGKVELIFDKLTDQGLHRFFNKTGRNLHIEDLPRDGSRGQRVNGDCFNAQRAFADFSSIFGPQIV